MATRVISTSIKLNGEAEFKKQLGLVNSELKTLDSDMKLVTEQFKGQANTAEALTAKQKVLTGQIDQQEEKVKALRKAVEEATEAYTDNDKRVDGYKQSLNRAETELIKMQRELKDTNKYLDEAESSADGAAKSIDGYGKSVKEAGDKSGGFGSGVKDLTESLGKLKGFLVGGAVVTGVKELASAVLDIEESTREYRQIMGTLEVSRREAGYSADQTAEIYEKLYSVLGDHQTAATATANLQAIGLRQSELTFLTKEAIGAWATYGDSIPIDGLAESINETIKAGQVTGTFADVLNWGADANETYGVALKENTKANEEWNKAVEKCSSAEDYFNLALSQCSDNAERADLVMREMAAQGLKDAADAWVDVNSDIVEANESQAEWDRAMGELGEALVPAANALRDLGTEAIGYVTEMVINATNALRDLKKAWDDFFSGGDKAKSAKFVVDETEIAMRQAEEYKTTQGLATAGISEPHFSSADVNNAAAAVVNGVNAGRAAATGTPTAVKTTINIDGRAVAEAISPALRDTNKSNPEVVSDLL